MPSDDIAVFQVTHDAKCDECGEELFRGRMLRKEGEKGLCLDCADLGHLLFLGAGDACVTRRARKYSPIAVVVLRWSRARKRYERQGLLLTQEAIDRAEEECLGDAELRERRQLAAALRRDGIDADSVRRFAEATRARYPAAPAGVESTIAHHACAKNSGRIGRTAAAKELDAEAIDLAVRAHVRHSFTGYDALLARGTEREFARAAIRREVDQILESWRTAR
jgi:predicted RNA-binding Zn-ribbon protein involved in translation (DUF1610 family)